MSENLRQVLAGLPKTTVTPLTDTRESEAQPLMECKNEDAPDHDPKSCPACTSRYLKKEATGDECGKCGHLMRDHSANGCETCADHGEKCDVVDEVMMPPRRPSPADFQPCDACHGTKVGANGKPCVLCRDTGKMLHHPVPESLLSEVCQGCGGYGAEDLKTCVICYGEPFTVDFTKQEGYEKVAGAFLDSSAAQKPVFDMMTEANPYRHKTGKFDVKEEECWACEGSGTKTDGQGRCAMCDGGGKIANAGNNLKRKSPDADVKPPEKKGDEPVDKDKDKDDKKAPPPQFQKKDKKDEGLKPGSTFGYLKKQVGKVDKARADDRAADMASKACQKCNKAIPSDEKSWWWKGEGPLCGSCRDKMGESIKESERFTDYKLALTAAQDRANKTGLIMAIRAATEVNDMKAGYNIAYASKGDWDQSITGVGPELVRPHPKKNEEASNLHYCPEGMHWFPDESPVGDKNCPQHAPLWPKREAMVRFATTCDKCGKRSNEYEAWPSCRECGNHICPACSQPNSLKTGDGDGPDTALCHGCLSEETQEYLRPDEKPFGRYDPDKAKKNDKSCPECHHPMSRHSMSTGCDDCMCVYRPGGWNPQEAVQHFVTHMLDEANCPTCKGSGYAKDDPNQGQWVVGGGGSEPIMTVNGRKVQYMFQPSTGKKAYYDFGSDMFLEPDEEKRLFRRGESIELVLWGVKTGDEDWQQQILLAGPQATPANIEKVKVLAAKDGFGKFRVAKIDLSQPPDFSKVFKKESKGSPVTAGVEPGDSVAFKGDDIKGDSENGERKEDWSVVNTAEPPRQEDKAEANDLDAWGDDMDAWGNTDLKNWGKKGEATGLKVGDRVKYSDYGLRSARDSMTKWLKGSPQRSRWETEYNKQAAKRGTISAVGIGVNGGGVRIDWEGGGTSDTATYLVDLTGMGEEITFKCQECGAKVPTGRKKCPKCGSEDIDLAEANTWMMARSSSQPRLQEPEFTHADAVNAWQNARIPADPARRAELKKFWLQMHQDFSVGWKHFNDPDAEAHRYYFKLMLQQVGVKVSESTMNEEMQCFCGHSKTAHEDGVGKCGSSGQSSMGACMCKVYRNRPVKEDLDPKGNTGVNPQTAITDSDDPRDFHDPDDSPCSGGRCHKDYGTGAWEPCKRHEKDDEDSSSDKDEANDDEWTRNTIVGDGTGSTVGVGEALTGKTTYKCPVCGAETEPYVKDGDTYTFCEKHKWMAEAKKKVKEDIEDKKVIPWDRLPKEAQIHGPNKKNESEGKCLCGHSEEQHGADKCNAPRCYCKTREDDKKAYRRDFNEAMGALMESITPDDGGRIPSGWDDIWGDPTTQLRVGWDLPRHEAPEAVEAVIRLTHARMKESPTATLTLCTSCGHAEHWHLIGASIATTSRTFLMPHKGGSVWHADPAEFPEGSTACYVEGCTCQKFKS